MGPLVVVGGSLGGAQALATVLSQLPETFRSPLVAVLHRHPKSTEQLGGMLRRFCPFALSEVEDKQPIRPGNVYLAPADYHLLVDGGALALSTEPPVCYARPSIDVLFESAADARGRDLIGVILTGAAEDGVRGLSAVKEKGGVALVQAPGSAESPVLPEAAIRDVAVDRILPLTDIAGAVVELCRDMEG